jgi:hypothetical protein
MQTTHQRCLHYLKLQVPRNAVSAHPTPQYVHDYIHQVAFLVVGSTSEWLAELLLLSPVGVPDSLSLSAP